MAYHIKGFNTKQEQIDFCYNNENLQLPIATINDETNEIILNNDLNLKYYVGNKIPTHIDENFIDINFEDLGEINIPYKETDDDTDQPWYILLPNIYEYNIWDSNKTILQNEAFTISDKSYFHIYKLYSLNSIDRAISLIFEKKQ